MTNEVRLFRGATGWLGAPPLTEGAVRGKVVLVDFWTYTCINWRRTLPYVRAWAEVDSDYAIWRAFHNQYWPALYLLDLQGRIRHQQFGEGGYEEIERNIQKLLAEAGNVDLPRALVSLDPGGAEAAADLLSLKTPETYLGYAQALDGGVAVFDFTFG